MKYKIEFKLDHLKIAKTKHGELELSDIEAETALSLDNLIVLKATNRVKLLTTDEFLKSNFASYILESKTDERLKEVEQWIKYLNDNAIRIYYLNAVLPDFEITKRIIIK